LQSCQKDTVPIFVLVSLLEENRRIRVPSRLRFQILNQSIDLHGLIELFEHGDSADEFCTRKMASSGILRYVALVRTDVSEELGCSFIRVTRIGELGTMIAISSD
jgi:hypothetical protein